MTSPGNKHRSVPPKPPERPQRPLTAYNYFFADERKRMLMDPNTAKMGFAEMAKYVGARWKAITETEKSHYKILAERDKTRYYYEMNAWYIRKNQEENCTTGAQDMNQGKGCINEENDRKPPAREMTADQMHAAETGQGGVTDTKEPPHGATQAAAGHLELFTNASSASHLYDPNIQLSSEEIDVHHLRAEPFVSALSLQSNLSQRPRDIGNVKSSIHPASSTKRPTKAIEPTRQFPCDSMLDPSHKETVQNDPFDATHNQNQQQQQTSKAPFNPLPISIQPFGMQQQELNTSISTIQPTALQSGGSNSEAKRNSFSSNRGLTYETSSISEAVTADNPIFDPRLGGSGNPSTPWGSMQSPLNDMMSVRNPTTSSQEQQKQPKQQDEHHQNRDQQVVGPQDYRMLASRLGDDAVDFLVTGLSRHSGGPRKRQRRENRRDS